MKKAQWEDWASKNARRGFAHAQYCGALQPRLTLVRVLSFDAIWQL
jgi:hypothetical protein